MQQNVKNMQNSITVANTGSVCIILTDLKYCCGTETGV